MAEDASSSSGGRRESLILRLKRKWFDAIAAGYKRTEYRSATDYWRKRIEGRRYDSIVFRNGFGDHRPTMEVEYKGWGKCIVGGEPQYALSLGQVLQLDHYALPPGLPPPARCEAIEHDSTRLVFSPGLGVWLPAVVRPDVEVVSEAPVRYANTWEMMPRRG